MYIFYDIYADDVNILGGSVHTIKENAEAVVLADKEIGLEVNADKTMYMVMCRDQNARHSHSIKFDNSSFERVKEFRYLGTLLTNQNSFQEVIKSRLKSGNAYHHLVQNLLSSSSLSKNLKIYRTIILPLFIITNLIHKFLVHLHKITLHVVLFQLNY